MHVDSGSCYVRQKKEQMPRSTYQYTEVQCSCGRKSSQAYVHIDNHAICCLHMHLICIYTFSASLFSYKFTFPSGTSCKGEQSRAEKKATCKLFLVFAAFKGTRRISHCLCTVHCSGTCGGMY